MSASLRSPLALAMGMALAACTARSRPVVPQPADDGWRGADADTDAGVGDAGGADASDRDWWDLGWSQRRKLVFRNAGGAEALADFPVLVRLDSSRIDYAATAPAGADLRFVDADGTTELPYEIERWDAADESIVWVAVPRIDVSDLDYVWLYYGNAAAPAGANREAVWTSFHAVWHLAEQGVGAVGELVDSTAQRKHAQGGCGIATQVPVRAAGRIGAAQQLDGIDDHLCLDDAASASFSFVSPQLTIEAWTWIEPNAVDYNDVVSLSGYDNGYRTGHAPDGTHGLQVTGKTHTLVSEATLTFSEWHYVVATYDGLTLRVYADGVKDNAELARVGSLDPATAPLTLGAGGQIPGPQMYPLHGLLDETRVANVVRSDGWIAAQYASMTDAFLTFVVE